MANLNVENLSHLIQTGDIEGLFQGQSHSSSVAGEVPAMREMEKQGMQTPDAKVAGQSFSDVLRSSVEKVNQHQTEADTAVKELLAGRSKNIHETMLAVERADTSLKLMMQVRNKILDAYKEVMRMQV